MGALDGFDFGTPTSGASGQVATNPQTGYPYTPREMVGTVVGTVGDKVGIPQDWFNLGEKIYGGPIDDRANKMYAADQGPNPVDNSSLIDKYKASGWNDINAITADIEAGGGSKFDNVNTAPVEDFSALKGEIGGNWDAYIQGIGDLIGGLSPQRQAQEGIAGSQLRSSQGDLGTQFGSGQADIASRISDTEGTKKKNIMDLEENMRNLFQSGSNQLGVMGAGDSSAARQYAYALTKLGSKQRTSIANSSAEIVGKIQQAGVQLKSSYDNAMNQVQETFNQNMLSVEQWFGEQQQALKVAQNEGRLSKGQDLAQVSKDILNNALQRAQEARTALQSRKDQLDSWAIEKSDNIEQLKANLMATTQIATQQQTGHTPLQGGIGTNPSSGQPYVNPGSGTGINQEEDKDIFGQSSSPFSQYGSNSGWAV